MKNILMSTQEELAGYKIIKSYGLVYGNIVRSTSILRTFWGSIRTLIGGEIPDYTRMAEESRNRAIKRMQQHAAYLGANAVVGMRLLNGEMKSDCAEIVAYGTAVYIEELLS